VPSGVDHGPPGPARAALRSSVAQPAPRSASRPRNRPRPGMAVAAGSAPSRVCPRGRAGRRFGDHARIPSQARPLDRIKVLERSPRRREGCASRKTISGCSPSARRGDPITARLFDPAPRTQTPAWGDLLGSTGSTIWSGWHLFFPSRPGKDPPACVRGSQLRLQPATGRAERLLGLWLPLEPLWIDSQHVLLGSMKAKTHPRLSPGRRPNKRRQRATCF